jgi:hypothetical protein
MNAEQQKIVTCVIVNGRMPYAARHDDKRQCVLNSWVVGVRGRLGVYEATADGRKALAHAIPQ